MQVNDIKRNVCPAQNLLDNLNLILFLVNFDKK